MPDASPMFTDFLNGEISGNWEGRVKHPRYYSSCRIIENFIVTPQGNAERAPGTYYAGATTKSNGKARAVTFYTADEQYLLEIGDGYIRYMKQSTHAQVENGGSPYETTSPWSLTHIWDLDCKQEPGGTMYITHPDYQVRKLSTTGDTAWTLSTIAFTGTTFSATNDFPRCVGFFERRMLLADTYDDPRAIWGSYIDDYENFSVTALDNGAYKYTLTANIKTGHLVWLHALDDILYGAQKAEGRMMGGGAPITPSNVRANWQTRAGSSGIKAEFVENGIVFVQDGGTTLREIRYQDEVKKYITLDLNYAANHILGSGAKELHFQAQPHNLVWVVRDDGILAALTKEESAGAFGWHRHITDGLFESMGIVDGDGEEEIWVIVNRTIGGQTKRYWEYFKPRDFGADITDQFFVHCGLTDDRGSAKDITGITKAATALVTSAAHGLSNDDIVYIEDVEGMTSLNDEYYCVKDSSTNTFDLYLADGSAGIDSTGLNAYISGGTLKEFTSAMGGLTHLEGEVLDVLIDGAAVVQKTVSGGVISFGEYGNKIHAGLPYTSKLKPVRMEISGGMQATHGQEQIVSEIAMRFYKTGACKVGRDEDHLEEFQFRDAVDPVGVPPPLHTGDKRVTFQGDFQLGADVLVVVDKPQACTVCAITPYLDTYREVS